MSLFLRKEVLEPLHLAGLHFRTCMAENRTFELWNNFMKRRTELGVKEGDHLYSIQQFESGLSMATFTPTTLFEKWAAAKHDADKTLPEGFDNITLHGLYAVFLHKGTVTDFGKTLNYIYGTWMPASGYTTDEREHFTVMGEKYRNNDNASEEEVWVPIKLILS